jgi:hypothetical protein
MNDDECDIETTSRVTRYQFTLLFGMEWPIQATLPDAMMRARYPTEVSWCLGEIGALQRPSYGATVETAATAVP